MSGTRPRRGGLSAWRAVLRIARRDAQRARWRSALVVALVALPLAAVTGFAVFARTIEPEADVLVTRTLGTADARYEVISRGRIEQNTEANPSSSYVGAANGDLGAKAARKLLPPGSRTIPLRSTAGFVPVETEAGALRTGVQELDYSDPLAKGIVEQLEGRPPDDLGEVAITPELQEASGLQIGDMVGAEEGDRSFAVVGVARLPGALYQEQILALPGAFGAGLDSKRAGAPTELLVDTPEPVGWEDVLEANRQGVQVSSREVILNPPPRAEVPLYAGSPSDGGPGTEEIALVVVIVGMAMLEIVLLAGAAFAVGARRQSRSLALLAAAGGEGRDLRRTVLAGGLLLGLTGALVGIGVGIFAAWSAIELGLAEASLQELPGSFDVRPLELGAIAALGAVTGVLAATFPARGAARQDVVAALAGRRGVIRIDKRQPALGLVLAAAGIGVTVFGAAAGYPLAIVAGAVLAQVGLIVLTPAVVGAIGRLGRLLPLGPRLALRDASRHRSRTTPAVAAIMSAVAGTIAVSLYVVSLDDRDRRLYPQEAQLGQAYVSVRASDAPRLDQIRAAAGSALPVTQTTVVSATKQTIDWAVPVAKRCPAELGAEGGSEYVEDDPRCLGQFTSTGYGSSDVIGDAADLSELTGVTSPAATKVLANGGAVFFSDRYVDEGTATAQRLRGRGGAGRGRASLPAVYAPSEAAPLTSIISPAGARSLGLTARVGGLVFSTSRMPTESEERQASLAVGEIGAGPGLGVERGYSSDYGPGLLALLIASAVITLGAAGIATALATAEGRPDQATLAAVGATPRMRKLLAGFQAGVVAGLGTAMGIAAGLLPGAAIVVVEPGLRLQLPWTTLAVTLLVVPLLAALAGLALTRARVPLGRRVA